MTAQTLERISAHVRGEIQGDKNRLIRGIASLEKAGPDEITFAAGEQALRRMRSSRAGACLVAIEHRDHPLLSGAASDLVFVDDPQDAFITILCEFRPQPERPRFEISGNAIVHPTAVIGPGTNLYPGVFVDEHAVIGTGCDIYPGVFVGRKCRVGNDCVLYPHSVLYPDVVLGDRVIVHAGAVIGADGFGYRFRNDHFEKIPQLGSVHVHDDCEIGACTTIDRGMIGPTVIGKGTKLDNLVMIGHNCELGKHNAFASQVGLAGSVTTGDYVRCAGQVGIADHVHLGQGSTLGAKAGVHRNVPAGETHLGCPARPEQEEVRVLMALGKTPAMRKQLREIETRLTDLTRQLDLLTAPHAGN